MDGSLWGAYAVFVVNLWLLLDVPLAYSIAAVVATELFVRWAMSPVREPAEPGRLRDRPRARWEVVAGRVRLRQ